jgi:hypothetical protein
MTNAASTFTLYLPACLHVGLSGANAGSSLPHAAGKEEIREKVLQVHNFLVVCLILICFPAHVTLSPAPT